MTQPVVATRIQGRVTLPALFVGSLKVSRLGFGGGLVWARRIVVERQPASLMPKHNTKATPSQIRLT